jgi:hypothetical protein
MNTELHSGPDPRVEAYVAYLLEQHDYAGAIAFLRAALPPLERQAAMRGAVARCGAGLRPSIARELETAVVRGRFIGALRLGWSWVVDPRFAHDLGQAGVVYRLVWSRALVRVPIGDIDPRLSDVAQAALHDAAATRGAHPELVPLLEAEHEDFEAAATALQHALASDAERARRARAREAG